VTSLLLTALPPSTWPSAPVEMTVSAHREINACPRRWALNAANYPGIWAGHGYPPRIQVPALAGSVVHLALETITKRLVQLGCPSVEDPSATLILKELGGYTQLVHACIKRMLERFAENPRARPLLEHVERKLRGQVPALRMRVQSMLARLRLPPSGHARAANLRGSLKARAALAAGAYAEVELRAARIGWKGKADLLVISDGACEITDFKTGMASENHKFQLQVYAVLWSLDEELNPTGRLVDRLVVSYNGGDIEVAPPTVAQIAEFEKVLGEYRAAAEVLLSARPPEARPSEENCRHCGVRQLCDKYWMATLSKRPVAKATDPIFTDVELRIGHQHGQTSWDAIILLSPDLPAGKPALLRIPHPIDLRRDTRVRVLDASLSVNLENEEEPAIVTLGMFSEMYALP
jgi:CRISPR/Cas system-associated exonuclease Cas4 (RecB family)